VVEYRRSMSISLAVLLSLALVMAGTYARYVPPPSPAATRPPARPGPTQG